MTVCLSGDVHHMSMETRDQSYLDGTEVEAAIEYSKIAADYDVPVTLFCTGRCIVEERDEMAQLAAMENVEIGGHNYWAFTTPVHTAWRALGKLTGGRVGSWNGPKLFQSYEIATTINTLESIGAEVSAWRDHAYRHDRHTLSLLSNNGISHFSDAVGPNEQVRSENGLTIVPVNTPPDHEHVYHAFRTPEFVERSGFQGPFGADSHQIGRWGRQVADAVSSTDDVSTVLAHPACMKLADSFDTFEQLCDRFRDTVRLSAIDD